MKFKLVDCRGVNTHSVELKIVVFLSINIVVSKNTQEHGFSNLFEIRKTLLPKQGNLGT